MKPNKFRLLYKNLYIPQFLNNSRNSICRPQGFHLCSCSFNEITKCSDNKISQTLFTGEENIAKIKSVSKKNRKLSVVEEKDIEVVEGLKKGDIFYPHKNPEEKIKVAVSEDFKLLYRHGVKIVSGLEAGDLNPPFFSRSTDILIIGGGPVGLSIAHAIRNQFPYGPHIIVMDKDNQFPPPSVNLSQGIVSLQQFSNEEEISILKYGAEFFSSFTRHTEVDGKPKRILSYDPLGSLILADKTNIDKILQNNEKLKKFDIYNKILDSNTLRRKFPWLNIDNIIFGSLGMMFEGMIDPWSFMYGLKSKSINLGVKFVNAEVIDFGFKDGDIRRVVCKLPDGSYNSVDFAYCIIAGGLEALNLVDILNKSENFQLELKLPLEERMRYEYCFYDPKGPGMNTPTVVESNGVYFRREGLAGHYVVGIASVVNNNDDEEGPYQVFQKKIKPFILQRLPHMKDVELIKGWMDAHDFCVSNQVGITGPHPETARIIFALGFSHLGFQYLPALARAVMEFTIYDEYQTIDFTPFHVENLWKKQQMEADKRRRELLEAGQRCALSD